RRRGGENRGGERDRTVLEMREEGGWGVTHMYPTKKNGTTHQWNMRGEKRRGGERERGKPFDQVLEIQAAGSYNILMDFKLFAFNYNFQVCKLFRRSEE